MKRTLSVGLFLFLTLLFVAGCATQLPMATPAPVLLATAQPTDETAAPVGEIVLTPDASASLTTTPAATAIIMTATPAASPTPTPVIATPTPTPPQHPTIEETLAAGLTYVQSGFKLTLPPAESFVPVQPPEMSSLEIEQALASGPWLVIVSPAELNENGLAYRTIIISTEGNGKTSRWWGQVDEYGTASTVVFTGMPRPRSVNVNGATGKIVRLPEGSAYERYFESEDGKRFGIASNKDVIKTLLANMTEADGLIQVWGELRYAVNDFNGRRILVRNYDLKDIEPETILARSQPADNIQTPSAEESAGSGPVAVISQPKTWEVIHGVANVTGQIMNPVGGMILIQVEESEGESLGKTAVILGPQRDGVAHFAAVVPFTDPPAMGHGRIAIYTPASDTGQRQLLGWQEVRFAGDVGDMDATILQPQAGAAIKGQVQVVGGATNIPTDTLLVRVEDAAGDVLGKAKAKIGANGGWKTNIKFKRPTTARPGVISVYVTSSDGDGLILLAQTPVKLKR